MITINLDKAKNIAHEIRRTKRAEEFAPLDIKVTIPSESISAETERQAIRDKYAAMQESINLATTTDEIKSALG